MKIVNVAPQQSGMVFIPMVLVLWVLGLMLLTAIMQVQLFWQKNYFYEKRYYQHFNQAYSALNWALSQSWPKPTYSWQCRQTMSLGLVACIKISTQANFTLVKGESDTLRLYYLAEYHENGFLWITPGHWLDFCPEKKARDCDS